MPQSFPDARKIILSMPDLGEAGCMRARFEGDKSWVEFRGPPYSKWEPLGMSQFERLHAAINGPQASELHAGAVVTILPKHSEYARVQKMLDGSLDQT